MISWPVDRLSILNLFSSLHISCTRPNLRYHSTFADNSMGGTNYRNHSLYYFLTSTYNLIGPPWRHLHQQPRFHADSSLLSPKQSSPWSDHWWHLSWVYEFVEGLLEGTNHLFRCKWSPKNVNRFKLLTKSGNNILHSYYSFRAIQKVCHSPKEKDDGQEVWQSVTKGGWVESK